MEGRNLIFILIAFFSFSCASEVEEMPQGEPLKKRQVDYDIDDILNDGKLTVLVENNTASYFVYRGRSMGFEYEILNQFAKHLGVILDIHVVNDANEVMNRLNEGEGEMIACFYTITEDRKKVIDFTNPILHTREVLVQRYPDNYKNLSKKDLDSLMIRDTNDLKGRTIDLFKESSYNQTMMKLKTYLNDSIEIRYDTSEFDVEYMIEQVAAGEIDYTIADESVAKINKKFYPNIDIEFAVSNDSPIGFGVRKSSSGLKKAFDDWYAEAEKGKAISYIKSKYFKMSQFVGKRENEYSNLGGGKISPYDEIIKREAKKADADWLLIAAIIYQESKFNPNAKSWVGAFGIMQFMPATGASYGVYPDSPVSVQIAGGVRKLKRNYDDWLKEVPDSLEAVKFTLASYNSGKGHVDDARRLAYKYGLSDKHWDGNVEYYMNLLSKKQFYSDEVVKFGRARGYETTNYVFKIISRYNTYKQAFAKKKSK